MLRGIYTAASGMLVQGLRSAVLANNLANVDTAGFQRQETQVEAFPEMLLMRQYKNEYSPIGRLGTGAITADEQSLFSPGRIHTTGNALDTALVGSGFFVIDTPGQTSYTRDGRYTLNAGGWLVSLDGYQVRGENGPIYIGEGEVTINSEGTVFVDGIERDRLLIVDFPDPSTLIRQGDNRYHRTEVGGVPFRAQASVLQGSIEMSNVNVVREMVSLIEIQRAYEANQKVVQAYDDTLGRIVNEISV
ncbi:MAG: flagellar basal-body rod protein FlgF [Firmicutes bacterium]|nr:flagellar basal-body rod protein FlgF [Bacillota bacterium]